MPKFKYKAIHQSGVLQSGIVEAASEKNAKELLFEKGYFAQEISQIFDKEKKGEIEFNMKIPVRDLAVFCNQFSVILKAGVPILKSLEILSDQTENKKLKKVLIDVHSRIQKGSSVSEAFREHSERFSELFLAMIESGEASGNLELVLHRMGISLTKNHKLAQKVKSAMVYPVILSVVAVLVVMLLLILVVPTFSSMYASSGAELPFLTQMLLKLGDFMSANVLVIFFAIIALIVISRIILRIDTVRFEVDKFKLKLPVFGKLLMQIITARYTQNMATLLSSGISLTQAIDITSKSLGNKYVTERVLSLINEVKSGKGIAEPLGQLKLFSPMVVQMTMLGEESGTLDELLNQTSDFYESEAEVATTRLTSLIEPIIIVVMGVIVLLIILSILLPMFGMYSMI